MFFGVPYNKFCASIPWARPFHERLEVGTRAPRNATPNFFFILFFFIIFFLRDFIFKKTLFEKLQYLKQEQTYPNCSVKWEGVAAIKITDNGARQTWNLRYIRTKH